MPKTRTENIEDYKYVEGLEKLGENLTRKNRVKEKELNKVHEFI
jgi:hypothetical protein